VAVRCPPDLAGPQLVAGIQGHSACLRGWGGVCDLCYSPKDLHPPRLVVGR